MNPEPLRILNLVEAAALLRVHKTTLSGLIKSWRTGWQRLPELLSAKHAMPTLPPMVATGWTTRTTTSCSSASGT
jgi:hypothetical protein